MQRIMHPENKYGAVEYNPVLVPYKDRDSVQIKPLTAHFKL